MRKNEHTFSIELISRSSLKSVAVDENSKGVLVEGNLGHLVEVKLLEDMIFELRGTQGTLRLDVSRGDLESCLLKKDTGGEEV